MRKSRKINVIHNLYNLILARKALGSTPSLTRTSCMDGSGLPAPGVKTSWKAMSSTSLLAQIGKGLPPCKDSPKGGKKGEKRTTIYTSLESPLAKAPITVRSWKPFSKVGTRQTIVLITSHSPEPKLMLNMTLFNHRVPSVDESHPEANWGRGGDGGNLLIVIRTPLKGFPVFWLFFFEITGE